jgi:hypothetical protein
MLYENLKPKIDLQSARERLKTAQKAKADAEKELKACELEISEKEKTGFVPMSLQNRFTQLVKAARRADGEVSRAKAAVDVILAQTKTD